MKGTAIILILVVCAGVRGQSVIRPRALQVTANRTTHLIFPAGISSVDRGSERIVVQKSTGNVLRVKADTAFSDTTNLSVITSDGKLYSFLVSYFSSPDILNLDLSTVESIVKDTAFLGLAKTVLKLKNNLHGFRFSDGKVSLSIAGMYTTAELLVCKLRIENYSSLSFETGSLRLHVTKTNTGKRRSVQETEIIPLLVQGEANITRENQSTLLAVVFAKAALGTKQVLQIDIREKGGERHLSLRLPNKYLLKARLLK